MINRSTPLTFFAYCRKSSEDDRQAASIGDQLRELTQLIRRDQIDLSAEPFKEERSAKEPGRPVFDEMLRRIERGEANCIVCWDVDRLYRNPVDEGRVRWLLQRAIIQEIRTPFRTFYPHDAGLLMGVEGGRATDHIITLRKGVLRGFRGKLAKGQRPGVAPPGYLNNLDRQRGERDIVKDAERFELVRRAWTLMLSGHHSVRDIQRIARDWGLSSRKTKRQGGKPYSLSGWYRIFTEPFYCGSFWWKEPGTEIRQLYKGSHAPTISEGEFDRVQLLLGRKGKPVPKTHKFAFTGLIRCGECGARVTAETKHQIICPGCRRKFSAPNKETCPCCGLRLERMQNAKRLSYTYYHCTKRKNPACSQRSVRDCDLEEQIDRTLGLLTISGPFCDWAIRAMRETSGHETLVQQSAREALDRRRSAIERQLVHISDLALSPDTDWELISRDEMRAEKGKLLKEQEEIDSRIANPSTVSDVVDLTESSLRFAAFARFWFIEGDIHQKRAILNALGSNLVLRDRKLALDIHKPLRLIAEMAGAAAVDTGALEHDARGFNTEEDGASAPHIPALLRGVNAVRTYWAKCSELTPLRTFLQNSPLLDENEKKAA